MLTFDDFLVGLEQFGQRIQPLMQSRAHSAPTPMTGSGFRRRPAISSG
jgi:hypothetical protein